MRTLRHLLLLFLLLPVLALAEGRACPSIVSQSPYITRALQWMGLEKCIVGVSRYDSLDLPRTGGVMDPDAKAIAALAPQLMITSTWTDAAKWQAMAPPGTTALRVDGFHGMADVETMLRQVGRAAQVADIDARVDRFAADWRAAAKVVPGKDRRGLIMSACTGAPYSYGRGTTLYDLFTHAGIDVVADHDGIHNFPADVPAATLRRWLDARRPDIVFALKEHGDTACNLALLRPGTRIVRLDAEHFIHPGPGLLDGLAELREDLGP
jgi:iron complex transport system substrate-binding protein